jgi:hypothetical protein
MERRVKYLLLGILVAVSSTLFAAKRPAAPAPVPANSAFDKVVDRVLAREAENTKALRTYSPLVETYLQYMRPDKELGLVPYGDQYFLTRVGFGKTLMDTSFHPEAGFLSRIMHGLSKEYKTQFIGQGFSWMMLMDLRGLDRAHYTFDYQGREFLGDLRCIVIDVAPKARSGEGRFVGRIWVEDRDFNIVRFNGTFSHASRGQYMHFDTWRLNMRPGVWLPAYVYSEDKELQGTKVRGGTYKAETRIWGYNVGKGHAENEFTEVLVDDASAVKDNSEKAQDLAPVGAERAWLRQAEDNVIERLERGGLLARTGEVDRVLNTVINNLEITNNLDIQPEVRCRVLLTSPLESFSVGHTIFVSRGMLDVLPDEASLAAVLSHELAHIVLGHPTDTTFAYKDRSIVSDEQLLRRMHFTRTLDEEKEADTKALAILQSSPYKDKLESVGLFLRQVDARRGALPHLIRSDMGNSLFTGASGDLRLKELTGSAPKLEVNKVTQIAALPLGGRIRVNPWNNQIEINKAKPVQLLTAREKMPFEVTPVFPHLTRLAPDGSSPAPKADAAPQSPAPAADAPASDPPAAAATQPVDAGTATK